jgi:hypothetical protein
MRGQGGVDRGGVGNSTQRLVFIFNQKTSSSLFSRLSIAAPHPAPLGTQHPTIATMASLKV